MEKAEAHKPAAQSTTAPAPATENRGAEQSHDLSGKLNGVPHAQGLARMGQTLNRHGGLPAPLKRGIERLSRQSMDDVSVHYGSPEPARLSAEAFARGNQIHLAPGQERHLPHEAWHVAQQKQGRVQGQAQCAGSMVNQDPTLEREADIMGQQALSSGLDGGDMPPLAPASPSATPVIQGVFAEDGPEWVDKDTNHRYRSVLRLADRRLMERITDGYRIWVNLHNGQPLPVDEGDNQKRLKKDLIKDEYRDADDQEAEEPLDMDDEDFDDESDVDEDDTLEFANKPEPEKERYPFIAPLPGEKRDAQEKKKPSLAFMVSVRPDQTHRNGKYTADDLTIDALVMSGERVPTRYGDAQKSHSVAFSLIRTALESFETKSVSALLTFLADEFAELRDTSEKEKDARHAVEQLLPKELMERYNSASMPEATWNSVLAELLYRYQVIYHLSRTAVYAKGKAKNRGEQDALRRLRTAEAALTEDSSTDLKKFYADTFGKERSKFFKDAPTPVQDTQMLMDLDFKVPKEDYVKILQHWHRMLHLAYPLIMEKIDSDLGNVVLSKPLPKGQHVSGESNTVRDWLKEFKNPNFAKGKSKGNSKSRFGDLHATDQAVQIRLDYLHDATDVRPGKSRPALPDLFLADELFIGHLHIGEARLDTQFNSSQMSHTVAWTLVRAAILSFSHQPLTNLLAYLLQGFDELAHDGDTVAAKHADTLRSLMGQAQSQSDWVKDAAGATIDYLRLDQRSASSTYSKEAKGNSEGHYIQILRQNEIMLMQHGRLFNTPEDVIAAAANLLDADIGHAGLSWENSTRAILRWERTLRVAFPLLMQAGGDRILAVWHTKKIGARSNPAWKSLPAQGKDSTDITTVADMIRHARSEGTISTEATITHGSRDYLIQETVRGGDNVYNAVAAGLAGMIANGSLKAADVADKLPTLPVDQLERLAPHAAHQAPAATLRAVQRILAPALRAQLTALVRKGKVKLDPKELDDTGPALAEALANLLGLRLTTLTVDTTGIKASSTAMDLEAPTLGLHRSEAGHWSTLKTAEGGQFDLDNKTTADMTKPQPWRAQLPQSLETPLRQGMHGRAMPVEGTFRPDGRTYAAWRTTGDNNCSFNGMALVLAGLVAQDQMTADHLAKIVKLPKDVVEEAVTAAKTAQNDPRQAATVEQVLSPALRIAAVEALHDAFDIQLEMEQEYIGELRSLVMLGLTGRVQGRGDLFSDPQSAVMAFMKIEAEKLLRQIKPDCDGKTPEEQEKIVDAVFTKDQTNIEVNFRNNVLPAYFAHMATEGVWGGAPELQALARAMGVRLTIFRDHGGGVISRDGGPDNRSDDPPNMVEIGMFRHRARAHWSAASTDQGAYNLRDGKDRLGKPILAGPVDSSSMVDPRGTGAPSFASKTSGSHASGSRASGSRASSDRIDLNFSIHDRHYTAWHTSGHDNNCSFNGMSQVIAGLIAQGRLPQDQLTEALGTRAPDMKRLRELANQAQHDHQAARRIEQSLTNPLRQLAVTALAARPDLRAQMAEEFIDELRGHAYTAIGVPWHRSSDLFEHGAEEIQTYLRAAGAKITAAVAANCAGKDARAQEQIIDQAIDANRADYLAWFNGDGMTAYQNHMQTSGVWAGGPELQALSGRLGIALTVFRDYGHNIIGRDEGLASAGSASAASFNNDELATLRRLDVVEGRSRGPENLLYFRRLPREQMLARLNGNALTERFMTLYDDHYLFRDRAPVEAGMFRHTYAHWSALSTAQGAYDLADNTDRRHTKIEEESGSSKKPEDSTVDMPDVSTSGKTMTVTFTRPILTGVKTLYSDHMFGGKHGHFDLRKVDPTAKDGEAVGLVNAANESLLGGGGIDGAIFAEEGTSLFDSKPNRHKAIAEWQKESGRKTITAGEAISASPSDLKARGISQIIHAVGPRAGNTAFEHVLRNTVRSVLDRAADAKLHSVIFANISGGLFGGDANQTAAIILNEIQQLLTSRPPEWKGWLPTKLIFNNFPGRPSTIAPKMDEGTPQLLPMDEGDDNAEGAVREDDDDMIEAFSENADDYDYDDGYDADDHEENEEEEEEEDEENYYEEEDSDEKHIKKKVKRD